MLQPRESCGILLKAIFVMNERMFSKETIRLPKMTRFASVPRNSSFQYVVECATKVPLSTVSAAGGNSSRLAKPHPWKFGFLLEAHISIIVNPLDNKLHVFSPWLHLNFAAYCLSFASNPAYKPQSSEGPWCANYVFLLPASRSFSGSILPPKFNSSHSSWISGFYNPPYLVDLVSSYILIFVRYLMKEIGRWGAVWVLGISCSVSTIRFYFIYFPFRGWRDSSLRYKDRGSEVMGSQTGFLPGICLSMLIFGCPWLFYFFLLIPPPLQARSYVFLELNIYLHPYCL